MHVLLVSTAPAFAQSLLVPAPARPGAARQAASANEQSPTQVLDDRQLGAAFAGQTPDQPVTFPVADFSSPESPIGQMEFPSIGWGPTKNLSVSLDRALQPSACQLKVLSAVNTRFPKAHLTLANLLPGNPQDRRLSQVNVNFAATPGQLASLSTGRYLPRRSRFLGFLIGYGPSLHIVSRPTWLDPHALVFSATSFTAHLDSAWADHPIGVFLHLALDVLRPKRRNPCP